MKLFCFGLNHRTASIEVREHHTGRPETRSSLRAIGCVELALLSTCNRVEVYAVADRVPHQADLAASLRAHHHYAEVAADAFYLHEDRACVRHLFRVASGLDSMVVGETEILGQTKRAYDEANKAGGAGPQLHRLFQRAFRVAKQIRTKTEITRGSVSVGSVAVNLAEKIFGDLRGRKVLVLGAGEASERTLRALAARGVSDLRVSNRSPERAERLATELGGAAIPFSLWQEQAREIDILISSTAAEEPLLQRDQLSPLLRERSDRPLFLIDIAVPRNIAGDVNEIEGVYLYDVDSLQAIADEAAEVRRQQVTVAEGIIDAHLADFFGGADRAVYLAARDNPELTPSWRTSET